MERRTVKNVSFSETNVEIRHRSRAGQRHGLAHGLVGT